MTNEYMTKEFWEKAPEGYDYWIVPSEDLEFEVDLDFHRYEPNWPGYAAYVDAKDLHWLAVNEGLNYTVYKRPKFEEETGKSLGKTEVKWDGKGIPPKGTVCLSNGSNNGEIWGICEILYAEGNVIVWKWDWQDEHNQCCAYVHGVKFKPLTKEHTIKEKLLDKWKLQGLEFSEDTELDDYCIGTVFDFILKNFDIKEKE